MKEPEQPPLFAPPGRIREIRLGSILQVEQNANQRWNAACDRIVEYLARRQPEITADDVHARLQLEPPDIKTHNPSAMGAVFPRAAAKGLIAPTGRYVYSKRLSRHGNKNQVWRSLVYKPK